MISIGKQSPLCPGVAEWAWSGVLVSAGCPRTLVGGVVFGPSEYPATTEAMCQLS